MSKTTYQSVLRSLFRIHPGEESLVVLMFLYSLAAASSCFVIGQTVGRSLFLSALPKEAIPYRFIGTAIGVALCTVLYTRFVSRYRTDQLIFGSYSLLVVGTLIFRWLLDTPYGNSLALLAGLFVYFEVVATLVIIQFWAFAAELLNPREAKRLFGLIAAGIPTANVVGGAAIRAVTPVIGSKNLIFLLALGLAGSIACVWGLRHRYAAARATSMSETDRDTRPPSLSEGLRGLLRSPLLLSITGIIVVMAFASNVVDYQFDLALQSTYTNDSKQMSMFLGTFFLWGGIAACVVQFFLVNRVLGRFGVVVALLLLPSGTALGSAAVLLAAGSLWAVAIAQGADVVFRRTINVSATNLLYLAVPNELRSQVRAIIRGIFSPLVVGCAGLLFLALRSIEGMTVELWSVPTLVLVAGWIALVLQSRRRYMSSLAENLKKRRLDLTGEPLDISDEATVQVLVRNLQHSDELRILHVLQLIEDAPRVDWDPYVVPLLEHPSPEVRTAALRRLGRGGNVNYAQPIGALFEAPEETVRAAAILAFCAINGPQAVAQIMAFLQEESPLVRGSAVAGLIRYGGLNGVFRAVEQLKSMLESDQPAMRLEGARVLGELQVQSFYHPLIPLFDDESTAVQIGAIHAAGKLRSPELLPLLLGKLGHPATRLAASDALAQYGPGIERALGGELSDRWREQSARVQIPRILQRIGTRQAAATLLDHFTEPDPLVRTWIYRALAKLRRTTPDLRVDVEAAYKAITAEIRDCYTWHALGQDLGPDGRGILLEDALQVRLGRALDRIFYLLALAHPDQAIESVRRALSSGQSSARAQAIELVDNLVEQDMREVLIPLIEAPVEQVLEIGQRHFGIRRRDKLARLTELARGPDPWLRSCALFRVGALGLSELSPVVEEALGADDALVRETALLAGRRILPSALLLGGGA